MVYTVVSNFLPGETLEKPTEKGDRFRRGVCQRRLLYLQEPSSQSQRKLNCHCLHSPQQPLGNCIQVPVLTPCFCTVGKSLPRTFHKVTSKGLDCRLGVYLLFLSLQPGGLVTPVHLPRANVFDCLEVHEMTETSSPNKTTKLMRRDESSQVPDSCGSGSSRLLKQPPCRRALKLQGSFFYLFRLLSKADFPAQAYVAIASCKRSRARGSNGRSMFEVLMAPTRCTAEPG